MATTSWTRACSSRPKSRSQLRNSWIWSTGLTRWAGLTMVELRNTRKWDSQVRSCHSTHHPILLVGIQMTALWVPIQTHSSLSSHSRNSIHRTRILAQLRSFTRALKISQTRIKHLNRTSNWRGSSSKLNSYSLSFWDKTVWATWRSSRTNRSSSSY